jgi:hypothetical protein
MRSFTLALLLLAPAAASAQGIFRTPSLRSDPTRTNYALRSETSCVSNLVQAPWTGQGATETCTSDSASSPFGAATAETFTFPSGTTSIYQTPTTATASTFTAGEWFSATSGTTSMVAGMQCPAANNALSCGCSRSDGVFCTATPSTRFCYAPTTVGTTPVRVSVSITCTTPHTTPTWQFCMGAGTCPSATTGTLVAWGSQLEVGTGLTKYIATTTAAVKRVRRVI